MHDQVKRGRGRPTRHPDDSAGRDRLIEAARVLIRSRPNKRLPRRELAAAAGVTPGLVTYYFPTETSLLEAVAKPIVDSYQRRLAALLAADLDVRLTFRSLILLFLEIGRDSDALIESYVERDGCGTSASVMSLMHADLARFFDRCVGEGFLAPDSGAFRQAIIWAVCRTVAQSRAHDAVTGAEADVRRSVLDRQADSITAFLVQGFGAERR